MCLEICLIGAGPRGLSVLERMVANTEEFLPAGARLRIHVVDPRPGSGQVWRTDQSSELLMNTVAAQVTLFTDESVRMNGPVVPGPSLYEWAIDPAHHTPEEFANIIGLGANSYPTRALYGRYLEWVLRTVVARSSPRVSICLHRQRAVRLDDDPRGRQIVHLDDTTVLRALDAVILAQGHLPATPTPQERGLAEFANHHGLSYISPGNPADRDLAGIGAGEPTLLRGLGLNFFDYLALLTTGRGGVFEYAGGKLVYRCSGREPQLFAGSRRGVPYHARGENEKGAYGRHLPIVLTAHVISELRRRGERSSGLSFRRDVWPLVAQEVETVYYATLLRARPAPQAAAELLAVSSTGPWTPRQRDRLLDDLGVETGQRWNWDRVARPCGDRRFTGSAEFTAWVLAHLRTDAAEAQKGNVNNPYKAALDVLRDLRNEVRLLVDHGGLSGSSYQDDLRDRYTPLNAYVSIGPPVSRIQEAIALIEAGILTIIGPDADFGADPVTGRFIGGSPRVDGSRIQASALIEARLPEIDLARTADPLLTWLRDTGQCTGHIVDDPRRPFRTGAIAVTQRPYRMIDAAGRVHPRRFAYSVPTEGVHWVTAAGVRPGVDSVILGDADSIARAVLALAEPIACRSAGTPSADFRPVRDAHRINERIGKQ
ncbi:FAD/NAD(P)-binding protein [Nocardia sp. NPDC020380]|uniref:FAD/NAD(P)-binding protein n=1 Tax=Nocardia sp. NPDC020380 TaxID=3364309 RepID=UPI003797C9DD